MTQRWIYVKELIPILDELTKEYGDEVSVECNKVGNLIVSDGSEYVGFINLNRLDLTFNRFSD
jgi:hypothetical protein